MDLEAVRICFWRSAAGREPVRDWMEGLPPQAVRDLSADLVALGYGWPVGMPLARKLRPGLWELRTRSRGLALRVLFTTHDGALVLLHGFRKQSAKTPSQALALAQRRRRQLED